jgi:hypothetical protein
MAPRVLVSEPLAARGLEAMTAAGLDVDLQPGLSPTDLLRAVDGAAALVIRSATQVTAEVLDAGRASWWSAGPGSVSTTSTSRRRHVAV